MELCKYLWITDSHILPWNRHAVVASIRSHDPCGIFLTGDISNSGYTLIQDLAYLARHLKDRRIFFVLGNHDIHFSSFERTYQRVREVCAQYDNLIWMTEAGIVPLNEETALIGTDGWYSCNQLSARSAQFLRLTFDHLLIDELKTLPSMEAKIEAFQRLARESAKQIGARLEEAIETYKVVYILTHVPPFQQAHRSADSLFKDLWIPYNSNVDMGIEIERIMAEHKKRNAIVLCGHVHQNQTARLGRNLECRVGKGSYVGLSSDEEIFI